MKKNITKHHPKRLLGVFAHPDDESFCAGGTFTRSVAHGAEVMVVLATRSEAGLLLCEEATLLRYSRDHFAVNWYPTGFSIIEQGEAADSLYLILSGAVDVIREAADDTQQVLARLGPGSFFGEEGLAYQKPRNAHVVAAENVTCLVFSAEAPTAFHGRGEDAHLTGFTKVAEQDEKQIMADAICIDAALYSTKDRGDRGPSFTVPASTAYVAASDPARTDGAGVLRARFSRCRSRDRVPGIAEHVMPGTG